MMCRRVTGVWLIIAFLLCHDATASQYAFRITFTDKNNTPYSLSTPLAYLSSRALTRRTTQGIGIDSTDLPVNHAYIDSVLTLTGGYFHNSSRWLNTCTILLSDSTQILNLAGKTFISNVKLVGHYGSDLHHKTSQGNGTPGAPAAKTTGFDGAYYGNTWDQTRLVNGNYLHAQGDQGQSKLIAVLDAGFNGANAHVGFDSMWLSGRMVDTFNFVYNITGVLFGDNHGTKVLSTMAGYVPGTFVGSAPLASYALYVTEIGGSDQPLELDNMIAAVEHADSLGADIISESVGYDIFDYPPGAGQVFADLDGKTTVGAIAANMATKKGMLFVATAGNDGSPAIPGWGTHILTPGDADSALTIGSVDGSGSVWMSSGYGPNAAGQVKPDVCGLGHVSNIFIGSGYGAEDGTSFSTPQIAGWAACLWQANPTATPYQIRQAIIRCASSYATPGVQLGYGVPNFRCTNQLLNVHVVPPPFNPAHWVIANPNPFTGELKIEVSPDTDQYVDFELVDMTGKKIVTLHQYFYYGYNAPVTMAIPSLPSGVYILKAVSSTRQQIIKLQKL
jgi:serine protease AprX